MSKRLLFDKFNQLNLTPDKLVIFTPHHTAHYLVAYKAFSEKPLIGHGPKTFRKICNKEEYRINDIKYLTEDLLQKDYSACATHPHNTYIQLLSETGIIGFFLFLLGFVHIIILMIRELFEIIFNSERKLGNYKLAVAISALIVFWPFSPSGNFFNNWVSIMNAITLGFYIHAFFLKKPFKGNII